MGHDDPHPVDGDGEELGDVALERERILGGGPQGDVSVLHPGDGDVGLQRVVLDLREGEDVLEDLVGLGEALVHVAPGVVVGVADVGAAELLGHAVGVAVKLVRVRHHLVHQRRVRRHRVSNVGDRGKLLEFRFDEGQRLGCGGLVIGRHHGHRVAVVTDLVQGDDGLVLVGRAEVRVHAVQGLAGEHRGHPRQRRRLARIDAEQARVREGAAQDLAVEHPRDLQVHGVDGLAGGLDHAVHPLLGLADDLVFRRFAHGSSLPSCRVVHASTGGFETWQRSLPQCGPMLSREAGSARQRMPRNNDE